MNEADLILKEYTFYYDGGGDELELATINACSVIDAETTFSYRYPEAGWWEIELPVEDVT